MQMRTTSAHISLFQEKARISENKECATTDQIPSPFLTVSEEAHHLLSKHSSFRLISLKHTSLWCKKYIRSMLLQQFDTSSTDEEGCITIFNSIQISTDLNEDPYYWIHCQIPENISEKEKMMMMLMSNCLVFEIQNIEKDRKTLQKLIKSKQQMNIKSLSITFVYQETKQITENKIKDQLAILFNNAEIINIGESEEFNEFQPECLQIILQKRSKILKKVEKINFQEINMTGQIMISFFNKWEQTINPNDLKVRQFWDSFIEGTKNELINEAIERYRLRMKECEESKRINMNKVEKINEMALEDCWNFMKERMKISDKIQEEVIQKLKREYERMVKVIKENNINMGKNYLQKQFLTIENRVKNRSIKLFDNLKQQMFLFCEFIRKKAEYSQFEQFHTVLTDFILNKTVECLTFMNEEDKINKNKQIQRYIDKYEELENQFKEYKKANIKKQSQYMRNYESSQQKITYYQTREGLFEESIEKYKNEIDRLENNINFKVSEKQNQFEGIISKLRHQMESLREQIKNMNSQNILHQSQIQKQKLLHKQTITNYETLLEKQRKREEELEFQLQTVTIQSLEDVQNLKKSSIKEIEENSSNKVQKQRQIKKLSTYTKQLEAAIELKEEENRKLAYEYDVNISELKNRNKQLQINLKMTEQNNLQYQSKFLRYNLLEQESRRLERQREQDANWKMENQKNTALLEQRINFLQDRLDDQLRKNEFSIEENNYLKEKIEEHHQRQIKGKAKVDEWVQTQFEKKKGEQLEEALNIISVLEAQYNKLKLQIFRQKYHP